MQPLSAVGGQRVARVHVRVGAVEMEHEVLVDRGGQIGVPAIRSKPFAIEERVAAIATRARLVQKIGGDLVGRLAREHRELVPADEPRIESLRLEELRVLHVLQPNRHSLQNSEIDSLVDDSAPDIVPRGSPTVLPDVFPDVAEDSLHLHGPPPQLATSWGPATTPVLRVCACDLSSIAQRHEPNGSWLARAQ